MHLATAQGRIPVLEFLHTYHRVDLDCIDNFGTSPLLEAVKNSRMDTVSWLRSRGVKLSIADDAQKAVVFDVCSKGDLATLNLYVLSSLDFNFMVSHLALLGKSILYR